MLETTWFIIWGIAWALYLVLDGFDLGLGTLYPLIAEDEMQRRILLNSMGPFWDGNEVWLITAGGVTFAAFPRAYAGIFSSFYLPLMALLFALILRGVAFEFRGKEDKLWWKKTWDNCLSYGSSVSAFLLGVFFANLFRGIPIDSGGKFQGNILSLLNPYAILGGITFLLVMAIHGGLWLSTKTEKELQQKAAQAVKILWPFATISIVLFLALTYFQTDLWQNITMRPVFLIFPLLAVLGLILLRYFTGKAKYWKGLFSSAVMIFSIAGFGFTGIFPNLLLSSLDKNASLTAFNSQSSHLSLKIMLGIVLAVLPIVIAYQIWVHFLFKDVVNEKSISSGPAY